MEQCHAVQSCFKSFAHSTFRQNNFYKLSASQNPVSTYDLHKSVSQTRMLQLQHRAIHQHQGKVLNLRFLNLSSGFTSFKQTMKLLACVTFVQYLSASNIYSAVNSPCLLELELALCTNLLIQAVTRNTFFSLLYFSKSSTGSTSLWSLLLLNCAVLCLTCFSSLL